VQDKPSAKGVNQTNPVKFVRTGDPGRSPRVSTPLRPSYETTPHGPGYIHFLLLSGRSALQSSQAADAKPDFPAGPDVRALALCVCGRNQSATPAAAVCLHVFGIARKNLQARAIPVVLPHGTFMNTAVWYHGNRISSDLPPSSTATQTSKAATVN